MTDKPDDTNVSATMEVVEIKSGDDTNASEVTEAVANKSTPNEQAPTATESSSSANGPSNATATVFAWVAFILINSAFIALVVWGSFKNWWIGLVVDIVYVIALLVAGIALQRRDGWKNTVLTSLVFLVALISMAVAGLYLPLNVFPCSVNNVYDDDDYYRSNEWVTNLDNLPTEVQEWWGEKGYDSNTSTFAHFESTGVTLFEGVQAGSRYDKKLWRTTQERIEPEPVPDLQYPEYFVEAGSSTVCFAVKFDDFDTSDERFGNHDYQKVACTTDGLNFIETEQAFLSGVMNLFFANERVWFIAPPPYDPTDPMRSYYYWGDLMYSVNPSNLTDVVLHSNLEQDSNSNNNRNTDEMDEANDSCTDKRSTRILFLSWLFLSALPALIAAIAIDVVHKFTVPTMPIGYYLGFTWLVVCFGFSVDPGNFEDRIYDFFRWWLVFTTGPWLVYHTLQHLTNRSTLSRRSWSMNFASLVYAASMFLLLEIFEYKDYIWQWVVLTLAVVPPLFLVNIITGNIVVLVVVALVIMADVWRLTNYIAWDVLDSNNILPIQFVVLGLSGLLLGFLGYLLSRKQKSIETMISNWASSKLGKWVVTEGNEKMAAISVVGNEEEQHV